MSPRPNELIVALLLLSLVSAMSIASIDWMVASSFVTVDEGKKADLLLLLLLVLKSAGPDRQFVYVTRPNGLIVAFLSNWMEIV